MVQASSTLQVGCWLVCTDTKPDMAVYLLGITNRVQLSLMTVHHPTALDYNDAPTREAPYP